MTNNKLTIDHVLPRLKELFEKFESVEIAILFGSIANNKFSVHDIDMALKLNKEDLLETGYIITQIAKTLHINEDHIDIVLLNQANPIILSKILKEGIIIKAQPNIIEQLLQKAKQAPAAIIELKHWATLDPKLDKTILISRIEEIRKKANKMPRDLAEYIARLAGLRNILVHRYLEIKIEILYQTAKETAEKIVSEFIEWIKTIDPNNIH